MNLFETINKFYKLANKDFELWFDLILDEFVHDYITGPRQIKACGWVSSKFVELAKRAGFDADMLSTPGHFINVVTTDEFVYYIDFTCKQFDFKWGSLRDFSLEDRQEYPEEFERMKNFFEEFEKNPKEFIRFEKVKKDVI